MAFFVLLILAGIVCLVVGIQRQKKVFNNPHYVEAKVVGFQPVRNRNVMVGLANRAIGAVHPVVEFMTESGMLVQVKLHVQIINAHLKMYPELDYDGVVDVLYFGDNPMEAFLVNHPLEEKPVTFSLLIPVGIALIVLSIGMVALAIYLNSIL